MPNGAEWRLGSLQRRLCSKLCAIPGTHRDPLLFLGPLAISAKQHHMLVYIQSSAILVSGEAVYAFLHSKLSNPIYISAYVGVGMWFSGVLRAVPIS